MGPREFFWEALDPGVERLVRAAIDRLEAQGAEIREVSLPSLDWRHVPQSLIIHAEAAAYHREHLRTRAEEYGAGVRLRLAQGLFVNDGDYLDAQRARKLVCREFRQVMQQVDALVTPAVPIPAPRIGAGAVIAGNVEAHPQYFLVRNTGVFNLTGLPAVSVPCGLTEGLPAGLQIAGGPWEEDTVLRLAQACERAQNERN